MVTNPKKGPKRTRKKRGAKAGVDEAIKLITDYPLSGDLANPTEITRDEFDDWAVKNGYYKIAPSADPATFGVARGFLRNKIRRGASSRHYTRQNYDSFDIQIKGDIYRIVPNYDAVRRRMDALPARVNGYVDAKLEAVHMISESVDRNLLPWEINWHLKSLIAQGASLKDRIHLEAIQLQRGLAMAKEELLEHAKQNPAILQIPGMQVFISSNGNGNQKQLPSPSADDLFSDLFGDDEKG